MSASGRCSALVLFAIACFVFFSGCKDWEKPGFDFRPPTDSTPTGPDRTTRVGLIECFAKAHEDRDIEMFEACLHSDYQFWFAEDDLYDPCWDWTEWIAKDLDVLITGRMFNDEEVTDIRLDLVNLTVIDGAESAEDNFYPFLIPGDPPSTAYWGEFGVDIHVIEDTGEDRIDHWVDGRAHICLASDPANESLWTIWKIEDRGNEHRKATESSTWSEMKAMYRTGKICNGSPGG